MTGKSTKKKPGSAVQDAVTFSLPPSVTIENAEALAGELKQLAQSEKSAFVLDVSKVENVTTPGLQLIVSLSKTLAAQGGLLEIRGEKEGMIQALRDTGLDSLLRKPL